jgi:hypothetical protein
VTSLTFSLATTSTVTAGSASSGSSDRIWLYVHFAPTASGKSGVERSGPLPFISSTMRRTAAFFLSGRSTLATLVSISSLDPPDLY